MGLWPFNRRHPRLRRLGKWLGLVVVLFIVTVDVWSVWWYVSVVASDAELFGTGGRMVTPFMGVDLVGGRLRMYGRASSDVFDHVEIQSVSRHEPHHGWSLEYDRWTYFTQVCMPLWLPALLVTIPTAWLWWRDRPARRRLLAGLCTKCGYDRTGLDGKPCPECGCGDGG